MRRLISLLFVICSLFLWGTDQIQISNTLSWGQFQLPGSGQAFFTNEEASNVFTFDVSVGTVKPRKVYFITFSRGESRNRTLRLSGGAESLKYEIYENLSSRRVLKDVSQSNLFTDFLILQKRNTNPVNLPKTTPEGANTTPKRISTTGDNGGFNAEFTVVLQPNKMFPKGDYADTFQMNLYESPPNFSPKLLSSKTVRIVVAVPHFIEVSLGGSQWTGGVAGNQAAKYQLVFDPLETGASKTTTLQVRANQGFDLIISNGKGELKRIPSGSGFSKIPYQLIIAGTPMASQATKLEFPGATPFGGVSKDIEVRIGDVSNQTAGNYQGIVQIVARIRS